MKFSKIHMKVLLIKFIMVISLCNTYTSVADYDSLLFHYMCKYCRLHVQVLHATKLYPCNTYASTADYESLFCK